MSVTLAWVSFVPSTGREESPGLPYWSLREGLRNARQNLGDPPTEDVGHAQPGLGLSEGSLGGSRSPPRVVNGPPARRRPEGHPNRRALAPRKQGSRPTGSRQSVAQHRSAFAVTVNLELSHQALELIGELGEFGGAGLNLLAAGADIARRGVHAGDVLRHRLGDRGCLGRAFAGFLCARRGLGDVAGVCLAIARLRCRFLLLARHCR